MLPFETILAVSPPSAEVKIGIFRKLRLRPMTLTHAVAMYTFGCDIDHELDKPQALIGAWILAQDEKELYRKLVDGLSNRAIKKISSFIRRCALKADDILTAVNRQIEIGFKTYVPPKRTAEGAQILQSENQGYGWPLEMAEHLCGEYGWSFEDAMNTPVAQVMALVSVGRIRIGGEAGGPDYWQRREIEELKKSNPLFQKTKK